MKNWGTTRSMVAASMFCVLAGSTAWAQQGVPPGELETLKGMVQEVISENQELRKRVRDLEEIMLKQEQMPKEPAKEATPELTKIITQELTRAASQGLLSKVSLGGAIEVDARQSKKFTGESESTLQLSTAEFDFEAKLRPWANGKLAISFDGAADKLTVDEALIHLGNPETFPLFLKAGRGTVPFGLSTGTTVAARLADKLTVTDPLTLAVFDTKEDHVLLGFTTGDFQAGAYVFDGQTHRGGKKRLEHYGASVGYGMKKDTMTLAAGFSMIDSVFDADGLTEHFKEALTSKYIPGIATHVKFGLGGFSLVAAYYEALRTLHFTQQLTLDGVEAHKDVRIRPAAWHIEGGYIMEIFGGRTFGALSYSHSYELAGAFPKRRTIVTIGRWLFDDMRLAFDYAHDQDYARAAGGTGNAVDAFTLRLTAEW